MSGRAPWRMSRVLLWGFGIGVALGILMMMTGAGDPGLSTNRAQAGGATIGYPVGTGLAMAVIFGIVGLVRNLMAR